MLVSVIRSVLSFLRGAIKILGSFDVVQFFRMHILRSALQIPMQEKTSKKKIKTGSYAYSIAYFIFSPFYLAENRSKRENYIYIKTMRLFSPKRVKPTFLFKGLTICVRLISVCKPITQLRTINFVTFVTF